MAIVSKMSCPVCKVAKSKFLKMIHFDLRRRRGKNYSGVLVTVADSERGLEL